MSTSQPVSIPANLQVPIIGYHHSPLTQKFGIPRQPNLVAMISHIDMLAPYNTPDAFDGIDAFSHLWITWQAHHNHKSVNSALNSEPHLIKPPTFKPKVRPPRLGGNTKLGVFATRSTYRPAPLGLSVVALSHIEIINNGVRLHITGSDMIDGTPIIDIKPYIAYSDALPNAQSGFAPHAPIQKVVKITQQARMQFATIEQDPNIPINRNTPINSADLTLISELIAQDPRPAYQHNDSKRIYKMRYKTLDVAFKMDDSGTLHIVEFSRIN